VREYRVIMDVLTKSKPQKGVAMKYQNSVSTLILLFIPFLFTGCYTQFQTYDRYPLENDRYAGYYAWDNFDQTEGEDNSAYYNQGDEEYLDEQMALEEDDIYYKDYETETWYKKNYADKLYWYGYEDGFGDGYSKGYSAAIDDHYFYGYKPWAYNSWYRSHYTPFYQYNRGYHNSFWIGFGSYGHGYYSYPYYGWGGYYDYGYWGWHHPYSTSIFVYNDYHRAKKYRRSADLYRKGPRGSGLYGSAGDYRTRSGSGIDSRSRGSGVTRSRGINTGTRVRTTDRSSGRGSSVGKSSGTRSRGSSVGKSRSSSGKSRSRGGGSSVGRSNGSSKSSGSGKTGKSRSRSGNNYSALSTTSVRDINIPDVSTRTYTIPARRGNSTFSGYSSTFSLSDFVKGSSRRASLNSSKSFFDRVGASTKRSSTIGRTNTSSKTTRSITRSTSSSSRSSSVSRSRGSSSSKSSGSSGSKRSRGGN